METQQSAKCCEPFWGAFAGSRVGAVVRVLASHQCVPGSIPGPGVICGLSLLLVLFLAARGFSPGTPVFLPPQNSTSPKSNSSGIADQHKNQRRLMWLPLNIVIYERPLNICDSNIYMLFAGLGSVRMVKNCDRGLENAARGRRPRAAFSSPRL